MLLINCKVKVSLTQKPNFVQSNLSGASTFRRSDARIYVPIITLSTEDNAKLPKLLSKGFKRPLYWNTYKVVPEKSDDANTFIRESTDSLIVVRESTDFLFLLMRVVLIELQSILTEATFFQEQKLKITTLKLMKEILMISRLMFKKQMI